MVTNSSSSIQNINDWRLRVLKTNALLILIKKQNVDPYSIIDKIYLYVKDPNEAKYKCLIKKCKKNGLKILKNLKALIAYSNYAGCP